MDETNDQDQLAQLAMALLLASEQGQAQQVRGLLLNNPPLNRVFEDWSALSIACARGHEEVVEVLLDAGADPMGAAARPSLQCAASGGHASVVQKLLNAGADPEQEIGDLPTPLAIAAELGSVPTMTALMQKISSVDQRTQHRETPLHRAAYAGQTRACEWLLEQGADLEARNVYQETPLMRSVIGCAVETVQLLLERGARTQVKDVDGRSLHAIVLVTEHQQKRSLSEIQQLLNRY